MSNRSRRNTERLDYTVLHETGERVSLVSESEIEKLASSLEGISIMSSIDKLKSNERRVAKDVNECLEMTDLKEISDIEMVDEYIAELMSNHRKYRDIHDDLQDALGIDEYKKGFSKGSQTLARLKSEIKKAKAAKVHLKQQKEETIRKKQELKEDRLRKEQEEKEEKLRKEKEEKEEKFRKEQEKLRKEKEEKERKIYKRARS